MSRDKAMADLPAYQNVLHMPIPGPCLHGLPILPPPSHANYEQWARRRGFLINWNHQELRHLPPVTHPLFFAAVSTWHFQMTIPINFNTKGSSVAYYARDKVYRSSRDAHSDTMAIWVTEYSVMACHRWVEKARDCRCWLFSHALFRWVEQIKPKDLAGEPSGAFEYLRAMSTLRAALPFHDRAFHLTVRRLETPRRDKDGWLSVVTGKDADGVRIVIVDPLKAAACSVPAACMAAPPEKRLGPSNVPIASFGIPSDWASAVARRTGGSGSSTSGGLPLPLHQRFPPPRASLVDFPVPLATTAPSSGAGPATPVVRTVAIVATANCFPLPRSVPDSLFLDSSTTIGSAGEMRLQRLGGRLRGPSDGFPNSVILVSMVDLLGRLANDSFTWAETHQVNQSNALEAGLQGFSRSGVSDRLWHLLSIHQQRQDRPPPVDGDGRSGSARGSGTSDRRIDAAGGG